MDTSTPHWFDLGRHEDPSAADGLEAPATDGADGDPAAEGQTREKREDPKIAELRKERARRQEAEKAASDALAKVKEFEDRDKSEQEKLAERAKAAEDAAAKANEALLRATVAIDKQLPPALAARLQGDTREAMEADADALLALIPTKPAAPTPADAGVGTGGRPPAPTNFRDADKAEIQAELRKYGVRLP